jgi:Pvc16 N-terminal domain
MSNYLGIATVTATLQRTLQASVQLDVDGARVTTVRPDRIGNATPETGVNLYLYEVALNTAWRSADLRNRYSEEKYSKRSQTGLDLYYLVTCYGNDIELEPQRLLGSIIRSLNSKAIVSQEMIQETITDSTFTFLADSNLSEQVEIISITPLDMNIEEISKIWTVFFQTPYSLSIGYKASVVLIDGGELVKKPLPVRKLQPHVTSSQPVITKIKTIEEQSKYWQVELAATPLILTSSTLIIQGDRLESDVTLVSIGNVRVTPQSVTSKEITVDLASANATSLSAGVQSLQVLHPQRGANSNILPIMLRPTITSLTIARVQDNGDGTCDGEITVQVDVTVDKSQSVTLILTPLLQSEVVGYSFDITKNRRPQSNSITFDISNCVLGRYLVRLVVDGAESLLTVDSDPNSSTFEQYIGPIIDI